MEKLEFDTSKMKLAQVRYFNEEKQSTEIPTIQGYVFLININGNYVNIFNSTKSINVYDRLPYSNTTIDGEDYGNKLVICSGEVSEGICYVIEPFDIKLLLGEGKITYKQLEDVIINSNNFFVDRIHIIEDRKVFIKNRIKYKKILEKDRKSMAELDRYLNAQGNFQYKK